MCDLEPVSVRARKASALRIGVAQGKMPFEPRVNFAPFPNSELDQTFWSIR